MKQFETLRTWLIIGGLLLFSGLASMTWIAVGDQVGLPFPVDLGAAPDLNLATESEPVVIQLDQYLLGEVLVEAPLISRLDGVEVHPLLLAGILTAITVGGLVAAGIPLAIIYVRLDQQSVSLKEDPEFQEGQSAVESRHKERFKEMNERAPAQPGTGQEAPLWAVLSVVLAVLFFVILIGFALADTFYPQGEIELAGALVDPAVPLAGALSLLSLLVMAAFNRRASLAPEEETESEEEGGIPWSTIWVVVTGLIFIGVGIGIMLVIRGAGG